MADQAVAEAGLTAAAALRPQMARRLFAWALLSGLLLMLAAVVLLGQSQYRELSQSRIESAQRLSAQLTGRLPEADLRQIWGAADEASGPSRRVQAQLAALSRGTPLALLRQRQSQAMLIAQHAWPERPAPGLILEVVERPPAPRSMIWGRSSGLMLPVADDYLLLYLDNFPSPQAWWQQWLWRHAPGWLSLALMGLALAAWQYRRDGKPLDGLQRGLARSLREPRTGLLRTSDHPVLAPLTRTINGLLEQVRERNRLRRALDRYLSRAVVQQLGADENFSRSGGEKRIVTVLFADLFQFTELTANLAPERVVQILNACFEALVEAIHAHGGELDKYIGDGLMAIFGGHDQDPQHPARAVRAALDMQAALGRLRRDLGLPELRVGIGINTGPAIVGNIGSEEHLDYTAIGSAVNLAARLEDFTRSLGAAIVVGSETMQRMGDEFVTERIDGVVLKGVPEMLSVFRIHGHTQPPQ